MNNKWQGARVALASLAAIIVALLFGISVIMPNGISATQLAQGVLVAVILVTAIAYLRLAFLASTTDTSLPESAEVRDVAIPDLESVDRLFDDNGHTALTVDHVRVFLGGIVATREFIVRISEHVESFHRSYLVRSTFSLRLDQLDSPIDVEEPDELDFVVPLFLPTKRGLIDGVKVTNGKGNRVSTIDSDAQLTFIAAVLRFVIRNNVGVPAYRDYIANNRKLERETLKVVARTQVTDDDLSQVTAALLALPGQDRLYLQVIADFVGELSKGRPISVAIPGAEVRASRWPSTLRFVLERRLIPPTQPAPTGPDKLKYGPLLDHLRLALAVRLNRIYFPLSNAYRTPSYHLEIAGPDGTYLAAEQFHVPKLSPTARLTFDGGMQPRYGQRRSHLYLHRLEGPPGAYQFAKFYERGPGSFAGATIAGVVSTVLIVVLALMNGSTNATVQSHITSVVPTLLALPVGIAAFVGLEASNGKRHPSLLSRFVVFTTAALSLTAFVLAVGRGLNGATPQWAWQLLTWVSVSITVTSFLTWVLRLIVENWFVRRAQKGEGA